MSSENNEGKIAKLVMVRSMTNSVASGNLRRLKNTIKVLDGEHKRSLSAGLDHPWTIDYFTLTLQAQDLAGKAALDGNPEKQRKYENIEMFLKDKHRTQTPNSRFVMPKVGGSRRSRTRGRARASRLRSRRVSRRSSH